MKDKIEKGFRFYSPWGDKGLIKILYKTSNILEKTQAHVEDLKARLTGDINAVKAEAVFEDSKEIFDALLELINKNFKASRQVMILQLREEEELKKFEDKLVELHIKVANSSTKYTGMTELRGFSDKLLRDISSYKEERKKLHDLAIRERKKFYMIIEGKDSYLSQFRNAQRVSGIIGIDSRKLLSDQISKEDMFKLADEQLSKLEGDFKTGKNLGIDLAAEEQAAEQALARCEEERMLIEKEYDNIFSLLVDLLKFIEDFGAVIDQLEKEGYGQVKSVEKKSWLSFMTSKKSVDIPPLEKMREWETQTHHALLLIVGSIVKRLFIIAKKS